MQTCKACGHIDKFDFHVPNEIWEAVVPSRFRRFVVCLACFDGFANKKGVVYSPYIRALYFAGDQAVFTFRPTNALDVSQFWTD